MDAHEHNAVDGLIITWAHAVTSGEHPALAGRPLRDRKALANAVVMWAGFGDPHRQGAGQCVHASYIVRHLLAAAGIECEPVTVRATVRSPEGQSAVVGAMTPQNRTSPITGVRYWSGHEVVHVPAWNVVVDPTLFQVAADIPTATILSPLVVKASHRQPPPVRLSPPHRFGGDLVEPGWSATYVVTKPNQSYRDDPAWPQEEAELMRAMQFGYEVWRHDGLLAPPR